MAAIDPKTMKKSGFWGRKVRISQSLCLPIWSFLGQQQSIDLRDTLMPLPCFQLRKKVAFLAIFYCARRSGI